MASGNITIAVTLLFTVNLVILLFSGFIGVPTVGDFVVYQMFSREDYDAGRITNVDDEFGEGFDQDVTQETSVGLLLNIVDGLKKIFSIIITILGFGFALLAMLVALNAPFAIVMLLGLPVAVGFYVSVLGAVRGKDL